MEITIARATPDDVLGIQGVTYYAWLATYPNAEHGITVDDIEDWYKDRHTEERIAQGRELMANPPDGETTLIAKEGGKIVSALRAIKHPDRNQIYAIYVLPEHHGRGIGTAMWQKAQQYLDSNKLVSWKLPYTTPRPSSSMDDLDLPIPASACLLPGSK